jgi:hypothetical protein
MVVFGLPCRELLEKDASTHFELILFGVDSSAEPYQ